MRSEIRKLLSNVRKPFRLVGGEVGSSAKNWDEASVRICLAFPDVYEIGMSNIGLAILYDIINSQDNFLAERVFAPWGDVEKELKKNNVPLFSLESQRPLAEFDILGISLPYELTYTNILMMLELAGIPLRSADRDDSHPLVIAGGPCAFNPEPMADFFDAIALGDGENTILEIANAVKESKDLSSIRGVYVPKIFRGSKTEDRGPVVNKSIVPDLESSHFPESPVVAHAAIQDRVGIEVQRGCVRGCRFCQAGMIYRPMRQRSPHRVQDLALCQLENGGHTDLSFLSLSVGDYSCLEDVLSGLGEERSKRHLNVSLPSLRTESLTREVLERLGNDRAGSFTLAPEASTERMRNFINKGNTDEDLYASEEKAFQNGWSKIKLYFMVGLPGEGDEEIDGIIRMANSCLEIGRRYHRRPDVTVSTSTFVPKPHTPLQWSHQIGIDEAIRIQKELKKRLRRPGIYYRWHNADMSFLEGVFSRGGRELSDAIEAAYRMGARFDGWDECFDMERWQKVFSECKIEPCSYLDERGQNDALPWDHLFVELKKDFLWNEYEKAKRGEFTPSCADDSCQSCGICDFEQVKNRTYSSIHRRGAADASSKVGVCSPTFSKKMLVTDPGLVPIKIRVRFSKLDNAAFLGHLELMDSMRRIVRRAGLPICYTQGFHPRPKVSLGPALSVGVESITEFCDLELENELQSDDLLSRLNAAAQEGIEFLEITPREGEITATLYEVELPQGSDLDNAINAFLAVSQVPITVTKKGKEKMVDLKEVVTDLAVKRDSVVRLTISNGGPTVKAAEALKVIFQLEEDDVHNLRIKKVGVRQ
jgi:radical SAM family uncharacterized protein/radical SAM-linked protein